MRAFFCAAVLFITGVACGFDDAKPLASRAERIQAAIARAEARREEEIKKSEDLLKKGRDALADAKTRPLRPKETRGQRDGHIERLEAGIKRVADDLENIQKHRIPFPPRLQDELKVGDIGHFPRKLEVLKVVDAKTMVVDFAGTDVLVVGVETKDATEGSKIGPRECFEVTGPKQRVGTSGKQEAVLVLEPIDISAELKAAAAKSAPAKKAVGSTK